MQHFFMINPKPFVKKAALDRVTAQIEAFLEKENNTLGNMHLSRYPRDAIGIIKTKWACLPSNEKKRVYAVGGDGILFDCLNGVVDTDMELTVIPYGGANDFLRNFGENAPPLFRDLRFSSAWDTIATDAFSCNTNYALNYCIIGIEGYASLVANRIINILRNKVFVLPQYLLRSYEAGSVYAFFKKKIREQYYTVIIDEKDYSGNYAGIFIANGACFGCNKIVSLEARPNNGILNVMLIKSTGALTTSAIWRNFTQKAQLKRKARKGRDTAFHAFSTEVSGKKINIQSSSYPLHVCLDGEFFREFSLTIEVQSSKIMFAAPQGLSYNGVGSGIYSDKDNRAHGC